MKTCGLPFCKVSLTSFSMFIVFPPGFVRYWCVRGMKVISPGCYLGWDICTVSELRSWKSERQREKTSEDEGTWMQRKIHISWDVIIHRKHIYCILYHWNTNYMTSGLWLSFTSPIEKFADVRKLPEQRFFFPVYRHLEIGLPFMLWD